MSTLEYIFDANGVKKAVIVPYDLFKELLECAQDAIDISLIEEVKNEPLFDWEEVKKDLKRDKFITTL
ncbi:MAG: hypothetical protein HQ591_08885 [candidate division Zixibacteria bacterium]|nr:hypothetical protein [Candidatus Tariuqbacter arcticus]